MKMKLAVVAVLLLFGSFAVSIGGPPDGHGHDDDPEPEEFTVSDVGGGGWLHSGTFHPLLSGTILIGTDLTGGIYRTDDFGESWLPWNEGLPNSDQMWSMYVEDMVGVVEPGGTVAFYAATWGGIYRAPDEGPWDWMGDDQPRDENGFVDPGNSLVYWRINGDQFDDNRWHREPISFSCLDWNGDNLIVAGAGRVRWGAFNLEPQNYPGTQVDEIYSELECDSEELNPDYPCNPQIHPVWIHDLEHPENGWQPLATPDGFGTPRDISLTKIEGNNYLAVATHTGIYFYDFSTDQWHTMDDNYFWHESLIPAPQLIAYGSELTAWSIHLTERGTLYAAMQRLDEESLASGVYRVSNFLSNTEMPWVWVGDEQPVIPHTLSLWEIGLGEHKFGQPDLIYLSVVDGEGEDPDTLYLGDRAKYIGLLKAEQPLDFTGGEDFIPSHWSVLAGHEDWIVIYPEDFDLGWKDYGGLLVLFHPVVTTDGSTHKLAVQFNGRMHVSADGGETWDQRYCEEKGDDGWSSRGYNEHGILYLTYLDDGKPIFSAGDTGTYIGLDTEGTAYKHVHPEIFWDSQPSDNMIKNTETYSVQARPDWNGGSEDALFINYGDGVQKMAHGKLFMQLYDSEYGVSNDPLEWFNITKTVEDNPELGDLNRYLFGDLVFINDETCLLSYTRYTGAVGDSDIANERYGVLKGVFNGWQSIDGLQEPVWTWEDWSAGLPEADGSTSWVTQFLYNSYRGDRIFMTASRTKDVGGGVYMLEPPESDTWQVIYDGDYRDGDGGDCPEDDPDCCPEDESSCRDKDSDRYRDFRSMAQSEDGSWLYVGTRGPSGGIGGLLLCANTSKAAVVGDLDEDGHIPVILDEWEILANDPDNTIRPFEFYLNLPLWTTDWNYGQSYYTDKKMTNVTALAVDSRDRKVVYVGLHDVGMSSREGLWRYDGKDWEHLSVGQLFEGIGVLSLSFNEYVPGQLLIGTDCQGLYIMGEEDD